ncbi:helix-turn-helix transcriptional regulator [Micromonospora sp. WMMD961]|uniref:helix-turn-helix domain-containing protein n=1 Tax=Micromonospora sp. WMMD961 TaxID=3016100 RepID=UPI002415D406|nr:helix-turn-helix transcriptional regulator [Micromonospora sp. WMMD961]MDG4778694.1 helix-turn-helix transcriptional regulator [Micromonospora sp. WMMD961]
MVYDDSTEMVRHPSALDVARQAWASRLSELRERGRLSYRELSKRTEVPVSTVADVLSAKSLPRWETASAIIAALGGDPVEYRDTFNTFKEARSLAQNVSASSGGVVFGTISGNIVHHYTERTASRYMTPAGDSLSWLFEKVPESIGSGYRDAWQSYITGALLPSFAAVRWVLEATCVDQGAGGDWTLLEKLQVLCDRGIITDELLERAERTVSAANAAVHSPGEQLRQVEVEEGVRLLGAIIAHIYVVI